LIQIKRKSKMLPQPKITRSVTPILNGDFDVISLSRDADQASKLMCKVNYIAIIPFERTQDDQIKSIYGISLDNHATGQRETTLIVDSIDPSRDQTSFDSVCRALLEEAGLDIERIGLTEDDIFYLGDITSSMPVSSKFKCYAVDVSRISKPGSAIEFTRNLSKSKFEKDSSEIVKLGFHQVVNGDFSDATILAGAFLLVSYFN
jgi:hypothetical protein